MTEQATQNRAWLRDRLEKAGLIAPLAFLAERVVAGQERKPAPWSYHYCRAYSDGHNTHGLRGKRLDHYASAFADITVEVDGLAPDLEMTLEAFWIQWDAGATFEGSATEHWHFA